MPARLRPADPHVVAEALSRVRDRGMRDQRTEPGQRGGVPAELKADLKLLTKHYLAVLEQRAPGRSVEVRVPPYAAVQVIEGVRHTRGTPPAVAETDPETWIELAIGELTWQAALAAGRVVASGERTDLTPYLPLDSLPA